MRHFRPTPVTTSPDGFSSSNCSTSSRTKRSDHLRNLCSVSFSFDIYPSTNLIYSTGSATSKIFTPCDTYNMIRIIQHNARLALANLGACLIPGIKPKQSVPTAGLNLTGPSRNTAVQKKSSERLPSRYHEHTS